MKKSLAALATACLPWLSPPPAMAYQIDCAILLCLSGGFPPSQPCARAKAEMIRRVTPWPIEPPLQIWRCPMRASFSQSGTESPLARLYDIAARGQGTLHLAVDSLDLSKQLQIDTLLHRVATGDYDEDNGRADVDISGSEFDFVRSIRVYSVEHASQRTNRDGDCIQSQRVRVGTYGEQGDFQWRSSSVLALPPAVKGYDRWQGRNGSTSCGSVRLRAVFIDWRDHEGRYGFEQVNY